MPCQVNSSRESPGECIRDFAHDFRAMCLKWKPDIVETEVVRRILNNTNPKLASCLRGAVSTVPELVRVGTMVERDWSFQKEYWAKVNSKVSTEKPEKKTACPYPKKAADISVLQHVKRSRPECEHHVKPTLLVVQIAVRDMHGPALLDTGCTFTLLKKQLWNQVQRPEDTLIPCEDQAFVLADGQTHGSLGKVRLAYNLHGELWTLDTYIKDDIHLALGLDCLCKTSTEIDIVGKQFGVKDQNNYSCYPFLKSAEWRQLWKVRRAPDTLSSVSVYMAISH